MNRQNDITEWKINIDIFKDKNDSVTLPHDLNKKKNEKNRNLKFSYSN